MFLNGIGVTRDRSQSIVWLGKAAEQLHAEAQSFVGSPSGSRCFESIGRRVWRRVTPWHKELEHRQFALDSMVLAVAEGHPLMKRESIRLRGDGEQNHTLGGDRRPSWLRE